MRTIDLKLNKFPKDIGKIKIAFLRVHRGDIFSPFGDFAINYEILRKGYNSIFSVMDDIKDPLFNEHLVIEDVTDDFKVSNLTLTSSTNRIMLYLDDTVWNTVHLDDVTWNTIDTIDNNILRFELDPAFDFALRFNALIVYHIDDNPEVLQNIKPIFIYGTNEYVVMDKNGKSIKINTNNVYKMDIE